MTTKSKSTIIIVSTLLIGVVIGLLLGGAIRNRQKADFERMPRSERFHKSMERIIQPTPEQKKAMDATLQKRYGQIADLREKLEEEVFTILDTMKTEMDAILTPEQKERLEKRLAQGPKRFVEKRIERLTSELQLSQEQQEKIREILMVALPDRESGYSRNMHKFNRRDRRKAFSKQMEETNEKIESVLTSEQREKFRESKGRFFGRPPGGKPRPDMPPPPPDMDEDSF